MHFSLIDVLVFFGFIISVVSVGILKSRKEETGEDYFLAGRGLFWWLIGFSLIAANISTEQFVGMSGNAASHVGLAIASYEWMAAITLVVVAFAFLPYFLRAGIFTMPEFLEVRYNATARTIMATATIFIYMLLLGSVTYSGALTIRTLAAKMGYHVPLATGSLVIGLIAMLYVAAGGLKACAWADLIQGSALILGGAIIMYFAFHKLGTATEAAHIVDVKTGAVALKALPESQGALSRFWELNRVRMNMFLPADDPILPWTALLLGLWIPNFYYWGLNQYITQRTLGSASLREGQKGIVFASFLKLIIPFVIVIPGIIAFNLFSADMQKEATRDNAKVMAKYVHANPSTQLAEVMESPADSTLMSWPPGRFLIALYNESASIEGLKIRNPYVLPILKTDFDASQPPDFTVFRTEDKAWKSVFPALAGEVEAYNLRTEEAARKADEKVTAEKFIAYKYDTAMAQLLGNVLPAGSRCEFTRGHAERLVNHIYHGYLQEIHRSRSFSESHCAAGKNLCGGVFGHRGFPGASAGKPQNQQQHIHHHTGKPGIHFTRYSGCVRIRSAGQKSTASGRCDRFAYQYRGLWHHQMDVPADSVSEPNGNLFRIMHRDHGAGNPHETVKNPGRVQIENQSQSGIIPRSACRGSDHRGTDAPAVLYIQSGRDIEITAIRT
jgi:SSS family solute:Na+ symporter